MWWQKSSGNHHHQPHFNYGENYGEGYGDDGDDSYDSDDGKGWWQMKECGGISQVVA